MKTITMDYETYQGELTSAKNAAKNDILLALFKASRMINANEDREAVDVLVEYFDGDDYALKTCLKMLNILNVAEEMWANSGVEP